MKKDNRKTWIVRAYTSNDKKYCFSSVIVNAYTRKEAREKAVTMPVNLRYMNNNHWTGGAGHTLTVSKL